MFLYFKFAALIAFFNVQNFFLANSEANKLAWAQVQKRDREQEGMLH